MLDRRVLIVDDEVHILSALRRSLRKERFNLLTATGAAEALELMADKPAHVVIADQRMPQTTGVEFLHEIKRQWPHTVRVLISGHTDMEALLEAINEGEVYRVLTKPWNDDLLKVTIRQCFARHDLMTQYQSGEHEELRGWQHLVRQLLDLYGTPAFHISPDGAIAWANPAATDHLAGSGGGVPRTLSELRDSLKPRYGPNDSVLDWSGRHVRLHSLNELESSWGSVWILKEALP